MTDLPDPRTPVLVGVGTASRDAEACELMAAATLAALADAGARDLARQVDRVAVPQGSWTYPDPARLVADRIGASRPTTYLVELGIPQQSLVNDALAAILSGASEVAVVVGGDAKRWARGHDESGEPVAETSQEGVVPDVLRRRSGPLFEPVEAANWLWDPVQQYAMIDNALRAAEGRSLDAHRTEIAELWSRFASVSAGNPEAAFGREVDPTWLATPSADNRPLAFPYNKWHSTQWTVNQAAALVLCSVEAARRHGVPTDRWVFPRVGLESSHAVSMLAREQIAGWPAMEVLGETAGRWLGGPVARADVIEVYSCFPSAVRIQQRALGLDRSGTPTVTGGMAFAGGPFNNFVLQAMVAMVARVRADAGSVGVVTTVSGLLTKPGIGAWSARPDGRPPLLADLAVEAEAETTTLEAVETLDGYAGSATVATYTVTFDGLEPVRTVALCDTADGRRCVVVSEDRRLAAHAVAHELIGARAELARGSFELL